jgi:hypothetical protein
LSTAGVVGAAAAGVVGAAAASGVVAAAGVVAVAATGVVGAAQGVEGRLWIHIHFMRIRIRIQHLKTFGTRIQIS